MAKWFVERSDLGSSEPLRFLIFPEDQPGLWIAATNPCLPREVQEEGAQLIAAALSDLLGV